MLVDPAAWRPAGIDDLEDAAWEALTHDGSSVVVAGPGAGKTEFLAQRAAYLLQTGSCPAPRRVLAISFKTDAAKNLRSRVQARLEPRLVGRLDSMTFDAFTKLLLDRFKLALPTAYRLDHGYDLWFPKTKDYRGYVNGLAGAAPQEWRHDIAAIAPNYFEPTIVGRLRLGPELLEATDGETYAVRTWWQNAIPEGAEARLTFTLINRLAELIVRTTPQIRRAIWATYPYVFVDECQDTTIAQFDFLTSLFGESPARVTGVGDNKQRIMGWAGALDDALTEVADAFHAQRFELVMNHRSVPDLIDLQRRVARMLEPPPQQQEPDALRLPDGTDAAATWLSQVIATEVGHLAADVAARVAADETTSPSDCAILVRQTPEAVENQLRAALEAIGIGLRNETERVGDTSLQDLLVEELTRFVVAVLRLVATERNPSAWSHATHVVAAAWAIDLTNEGDARRVADFFDLWLLQQQAWVRATPLSPEASQELVTQIVALAGEQNLRSIVNSYRVGEAFDITLAALRLRIGQVAGGQTWATLPDSIMATHSVPLLTVHKSKGLEFRHVYFLGLDDAQWWAHEPGAPEGVSTFFVGLSRARQTARFCFCAQRGSRVRVTEFFETLGDANVPVVDLD